MNIAYYRKLKNVDRLGTEPRLRSYNLLEHSYMVTVLFRHFASREDVAYTMVELDFIIHHDILETITGDLPYPIKNLNGAVHQAWTDIEQAVMEEHWQLERYSDTRLREALNPRQYELFKACDLLDLWIFEREEQALGNATRSCRAVIEKCEQLIRGKFASIDKYMDTYVF